jgi:hypothetical protein
MGSTERFVIPGMRICAAQDNYHSGRFFNNKKLLNRSILLVSMN